MMDSMRAKMLDELAAAISGFRPEGIIRVAIDGRTASGKTTLANELAEHLKASGRQVIRTSIDGFHRPKAERYARGRYSAEGYYYDARDLAAINRLLLEPLGPDGDRWYRTASHDLASDEYIEQAPQLAADTAVLIVDGTFLQRPELAGNWDLTVFVEARQEISEERGIARDTALLGGAEAAKQFYAERYKPAYEIYERLCAPASAADVIVSNDDFDRPQMRLNTGGRLTRD